MQKHRFGLLAWILGAIVFGIIAGQFFNAEVSRAFVTFNAVFGQFLGFCIPLIIIGLVAPAIGELGRGAGKWLLITAAIAYLSTLLSGFITYGVSMLTFPYILQRGQLVAAFGKDVNVSELEPYFDIAMPPALGVMSALLLAFILGIGMSMSNGTVLPEAFREFRYIIIKLIEKVIIPLLPLHVFGIFLNLSYTGAAWQIVTSFLAVVVLALILSFVMMALQYLVAGAIAHKNPAKAFLNMLPAYATALGTSSSAATIPVTLQCVRSNGISKSVAGFVVPLCATIHLAGSTMKITMFALAIMFITGVPISPGLIVGFIFMLGVTMIAAPGVPGGAIAAAAGLLTSMLSFSEAQVGLMFALYIALDSFGTAMNVTGDGAIAMIIDRFSHGNIGVTPVALDANAKKAEVDDIDEAPASAPDATATAATPAGAGEATGAEPTKPAAD